MNPERDQEAIAWLLRVREAPDDAGVQRAFDAWLGADDRNRLAYLDALIVLNAAAAERAPAPTEAPVRTGLLRRHAPLLGFAFGALAVLAVLLGPRWLQQLRADERSGTGELRALTLADGSRLELAPDSAIDVAFDGEQRRIELLRGALTISVGSDPRPLRVHYRDFEVRDIGTRFLVRGAAAELRVAVADGEVEVRRAGSAPVALRAGEQADWRADEVARRAYRETQAAPGMLVLEQSSLALALAQWSAYSGERVFVLGAGGEGIALDAVLPMRTPAERQAALATIAARFHMQVVGHGFGAVMLRARE